MKFSNPTIVSIGLLSSSLCLLNSAVEGRLGRPNSPIMNTENDSENGNGDDNGSRHLASDATDYQTYLDQLTEASGSATAPITNLQANPSNHSTPSTVTAQFPPGVFDMSQADDTEYMSTLNDRCITALQNATVASSPFEVLGCRIWFEAGSSAMPMALGTLVLDYNLLQYGATGYTSGDVNSIFINSAHAIMINEGCYELSLEDGETNSATSYASSSQYSSTISSSTDVDISATGSYGPVSVSAGYNKRVTKSNTENKATKVAYAEQKYHAKVGVLSNLCLNDQTLFNSVIKKYNLIDQTVAAQWSAIMSATDANSLIQTSAFQNVAAGGLLIPNSYKYGADVSYSMESTYTETSSTTSSDMDTSITAGLSLTFTESVIVSAQVTENVNKKASSLNVDQTTSVTQKAFGYQLDFSCIQINNCTKVVEENADEMKNDLNKLSTPYTHYTFQSLDDIVSWQTGTTTGLGSIFHDALNTYYTSVQCLNPGGKGVYIKNPQTGLYWTDNGGKDLLTTTTPTPFEIVNSLANTTGEISIQSLANEGLYVVWSLDTNGHPVWLLPIGQTPAQQSFKQLNQTDGTAFQSSPNSAKPSWYLTTMGPKEDMRLTDMYSTDQTVYEIEKLDGYETFYANGDQDTGSGGSGNCGSGTSCTSSVAFPNQNGSVCA